MRPINKVPVFIIIIYFVLCLLLHEEVEKPFEWFVENYGNERLSLFLNIFFGISLILAVYYILRILKSHKHKKNMFLLWGLTLTFSYAGYYILMPYKSEGIHFIQYSIMGYLCYAAVGKAWPALMLSYLLGVADEMYQFLIGGSVYVDYNDMVLNFFGSVLGVLLYASMKMDRQVNDQDIGWKAGWISYGIIIASVIVFIILFNSGIICIYANDGCEFSTIKWDRGSLSFNFWDCTNWGKCWHRIKTWEGIVLISILPMLYFGLIKTLSRKSTYA